MRANLCVWGLGSRAEALAATDRALGLDPVSALTGSMAAWLLLFAGEHRRAGEQARLTLDLHPSTVQALHVIGWSHGLDGRWHEAVAAFEKAARLSPDPFTFTFLAQTLPRVGRMKEAEALLPPLLERVQRGGAPVRSVALAYAGLGDMDRAFEWLDRGLDERDPALMGLRVAPPYTLLSHDSRFEVLWQRVQHAMRLPPRS